jgi:hypothetical protein
MPTSLSQLPQKFASMLVHPFASFNLFWHPALAATDTSTLNAFGIPRFGYPVNDPALTADPSIYSDQYCQQQKDSWEASKTDNPVSGIDEYSMTDPCLLEQTAVEAAGDAFTQNDDINNDSSSGSGSSTIPPGNGSAQELARQILSNKNIQLSGRLVAQDIHAAANNRPGSAGVYTSAIILRLIVAVGASHSVQISAIQSGGTGHTTGSLHYFGDAVDFSALDGRLLTGRDSGSISIMRISFSILPAGSGFGQSQCGITPPLPSGITTFPDTCNHLHVQVPRGAP